MNTHDRSFEEWWESNSIRVLDSQQASYAKKAWQDQEAFYAPQIEKLQEELKAAKNIQPEFMQEYILAGNRVEELEQQLDQLKTALQFWLNNTEGKISIDFEVINVGRMLSQAALSASEGKP